MKNPRFHCKSVWLGWAALFALAGAVLAEPPDGSTKKPVARSRPQVIYHLPSSSNSAATLHSQAKGQNNDLPVDGSTPTSPQISRENSREQPVTSPPPKPTVKAPRVQRSQSVKAKGSSHSGPRKSHKQ
jgi:hypothetical protein